MVKKFMGSPAYSGVPNSDIVLPDGDFDSLALASLGNTDYNAVLSALGASEMPRIVQFSANNWALYPATEITYADETSTYVLSYPPITEEMKGTTVTLQKMNGVVTDEFEPIGNGWEVKIVEIEATPPSPDNDHQGGLVN